MNRSRIIVGMAAAATFAASATHAAEVDEGTWDNAFSYVSCGAGTNSRVCTYDMWSSSCTEASTVGVALAGCSFYLRVDVTVVPILNATGRVVGCTSVALSSDGWGSYDSSFAEFDRSPVDDAVAFEVKDVFADGKPGIAKFMLADRDQDGVRSWTASGSFLTSCGRSLSQYQGGGAGSVTVEV